MSSHGGGFSPISILEAPIHFLEKFGLTTTWLIVAVGLGMSYYAFTLFDFQSYAVFEYMILSAPIWLPIVSFMLFFEFWLYYVQKEYNIKQGRVTLEIKLPQDIFKSPQAMELVLNQMYQTASPDNHLQTYLDGKNPPTYSLEIVSRGGDVRFYINTPTKKFKNIIETQLYAQYPGVEIHQLDIDYTAEVPWNTKKFAYFSIHFGLKKADAYPIKTYIDYGLDTMPKEEEKIDPITSVLEALGSINTNEFSWVQILINANRETTFKEGSLHTTPDWKKEARAEIKNIIDTAIKERSDKDENGNPKKGNVMMLLTDAEKDTIKAIERSIGKLAFNTVIRVMYISPKESFNPGERISPLITMWRSFDDLNRNAVSFKWRTDFDWNIWQDPHGHHAQHLKQLELNEYKRRSYTKRGHNDGPTVMTVEELATIFHLPGKVALTPSLARIPSKRAEPPSNLPIG